MAKGKLTVLVGGQYGSEGKGVIAAHIAGEYDAAVRVGSFNAGHTFYWRGDKHVQQAIPCAWINPNALIIIGRGAIVPVDGLLKEIEHIEKYYPDFRNRLLIDKGAGVMEEKYHQAEGGKDGWFNAKIGSTGEGCGAARIARMSRDTDNYTRWGDIADAVGLWDCICDNTADIIAKLQDDGKSVLIEGTQGSALSLLHSFYPYCTSVDTNAAGIISECGISPMRVTDILMVCRTYPIRVHGNSGPMQNEIDWNTLSERIGKPVLPEKTTVTKKIRRIGEWDDDLFRSACLYNTPTDVALTFANYVDPDIENVAGFMAYEDLPYELRRWIESKDPMLKEKLKYVETGVDTVITLA